MPFAYGQSLLVPDNIAADVFRILCNVFSAVQFHYCPGIVTREGTAYSCVDTIGAPVRGSNISSALNSGPSDIWRGFMLTVVFSRDTSFQSYATASVTIRAA